MRAISTTSTQGEADVPTAISPLRWPILAAVMVSMAMVAFEATIVSTAMPQIVADLGGLTLYSWVFSSYLLATTAVTVVFGKFADIYGRRPIVLLGIGVFLAGSILAGLASSLPMLIVARLIQGVGAGAMQPAAMTIIADLYPGKQRGKVQGYLAAVWAVSAVSGPLLGSFIVHAISWPWVFWINIPIGLVAAVIYLGFLREPARKKGGSVDIAGAILSAVAIAALMLALTEGGNSMLLLASSIIVFVIAAVLFVMQERRAPDPMISLELWQRPSIATANGVTVLASMSLMGLTTFLPIYVQGVLGQSAMVAGFTLTTMLLGWPMGATIAARIFYHLGARPLVLTGAVLQPVGALVLTLMGPDSSPIQAGIASLIMGFGMGLITVSALLVIQGEAAAHERGAGTASNLFSRNLGSTLGAAVMGAVLNFGLWQVSAGHGVSEDQLRQLLGRTGDVVAAEGSVRIVLQGALHLTFIAMLVLALATVCVAIFVPKRVAQPK
ncbi:EmrB/QacA subfamily drug resistance transporter [Devosia sp. UYZn731]|uniref:MDR family MFS transporter n=1 Tax=Devosia sp. UYZn731 TaxID=3156345 RepID=UPI003397A77B